MKASSSRALLPALIGAALCSACATYPAPNPGRNLTDAQCRDLTAIKAHAPPTMQRNANELAALRRAGYDPSPWYDPYYPDDLQAAQRLVDYWYRVECAPPRG
ncbi:DUF4148 domain-containing protein [Paraburkholderia sp. MMS20-SJTR3]|uniref:DUF4148 domain-containing protein n=1 Tax=Paraburkholderia sejongensis TaxID=2886946 RepID=A0ABS8JRY5_9BURK|nr:DUF4148 domain-containing protein [Paraburkholderia sp. MMS20-SJTR3]MCC8392665.1 DUF4148 domain-containing protein [Paraburkholderia sp. MMS20-SJTR3]